MLSTKIRTAMLALAAAFSFAAAAPAASEAKPMRPMNNAGAECVDGTWGKDQFGNVYYCSGGKWILWSMPAYQVQVRAQA